MTVHISGGTFSGRLCRAALPTPSCVGLVSPGISGERGEDVIRTFLKDIICYLSSVLCSGHAQPKNYIDVIIYFYVEKALTNAKL